MASNLLRYTHRNPSALIDSQTVPMCADTNIHTSIVIPTFNQANMLKRLVEGLKDTAIAFGAPLELIIVDNNSNEAELLNYLQLIASQDSTPFARINILRYPHRFNFSAINNLAAKHSQATSLCFLNNDIEIIHPAWLTALCKPLQQADTGCVGAMLYYPDNTIQHAGVYLDRKNVAGHLYKHCPRGITGCDNFLLSEQSVSAVTAACLAVRRSVFDAVAGFDEQLAVAFNDVDFCLKVQKAGYKNIWTPHAELYHHESKSRGQSHQRNIIQKLNHKYEVRLMKFKWQQRLANEPHWASHVDVNAPLEKAG